MRDECRYSELSLPGQMRRNDVRIVIAGRKNGGDPVDMRVVGIDRERAGVIPLQIDPSLPASHAHAGVPDSGAAATVDDDIDAIWIGITNMRCERVGIANEKGV